MEVVRVESIPAEGAERAELVMAEELYQILKSFHKNKVGFLFTKIKTRYYEKFFKC